MSKFFLFLAVYVLIFVFYPQPVFADKKFFITQNIKYVVSESGNTFVTQTTFIKNLTSEFYPTEFKGKLTNLSMDKLKARDRLGSLKIDGGGEKEISIRFNEKSVGIGKTYQWVLSYETSEVAKKNGRIWEIVLPKPDDDTIDDYEIVLVVPKDFGQAAYLKPKPEKTYVWNKKGLNSAGIFAAFGDFQLYGYRLTYHLDNNSFLPAVRDIALIPTTPYQESFLENLAPPPWQIFKDADGNFLARYILQPQGQTEVVASGAVQVFLFPRYSDPPFVKDKYLKPLPFWEDPHINFSSPKEIYDFAVKTLNYDVRRLGDQFHRFGAVGALQQPNSALCLEFTDLFVATARASGIPARKIEGYALSSNEQQQPISLYKDILHVWAEYFQEKNWLMVDPTWGHTTGGLDYFNSLDFNHIVFAIHGLDSSNPPPAGSYKTTTNSKDVLITYRQDLPPEKAKIKEVIIRPDAKEYFLLVPTTAIAIVAGSLFFLWRKR